MLEKLEYTWWLLSLAIFLLWLGQTRGALRAFIPAPTRSYPFQIIDVLVVALIFLGVDVVLISLMGKDLDTTWYRREISMTIKSVGQILLAGVIIFLAIRRYPNKLRDFGITTIQPVKTCARMFFYSFVVFGITFSILAATIWICGIFNYQEEQAHELLKLLQQEPPLLGIILIIISAAVIAPVVEELLFRGLLQNFIIGILTNPTSGHRDFPFSDRNGEGQSKPPPVLCRWLGIILAAAIWTLTHDPTNWQHWPPLFALGVGLGYVYERHGNLLLSILIHSLFNILPLTITIITTRYYG